MRKKKDYRRWWRSIHPIQNDDEPNIAVLSKACDRCPIDKMVVTNACRNCVAHNCVNVCPRDAIKIVNKQAYIIRELCVECGLVRESLSFWRDPRD